jgi:hypothetical protein
MKSATTFSTDDPHAKKEKSRERDYDMDFIRLDDDTDHGGKVPRRRVRHALAGIDPLLHLPVELRGQVHALLEWLDAISGISTATSAAALDTTFRRKRRRHLPTRSSMSRALHDVCAPLTTD